MPEEKKVDTIYTACRKGDTQRIRQYVENNGSVIESDENSMTMLHHLAYAGNEEMITLLLTLRQRQAINIDACDKDGWTPLHFAADRGFCGVAQLLLDEGANISSKDSCMRTPLHLAALKNNSDIGKLLVRNGVTTNAKNIAGMTALDCAKCVDANDFVIMLLSP